MLRTEILLLIVLCAFCLLNGQFVDFCNNLLNECRKFEKTVGQYSGDIIALFNCHCNREFQGKWLNVTQCEMEAATCVITTIGCLDLTCQNVADVLNL